MFTKGASLPTNSNTFDTAFIPLYPCGDDGKLVTGEYLIQRRLCKDGLDGKRKAIAVILRYAQAQDDALAANKRYNFTDPKEEPARERRATTAMLLLSIASAAAVKGSVILEPWVSELALGRSGAPILPDRDLQQIQRYVRDPASPEPAAFRLPRAAASEGRSAEATRFKKGQSGNPKGRPKKKKLDLPFTDYFDEVGMVRVNGKERRMTRLQFVLHMLERKAISGDSCMTAVLAGKHMQQRLKQIKREQRAARGRSPFHDEYDETRIKGDPFEQMLSKLRITNRRTTSRVLLEGWVVEAALGRFGERRLTKAEQAEVLRSTSTPGKVAWPDWWEICSHAEAKPHLPVKPRVRRKRDDDDLFGWP